MNKEEFIKYLKDINIEITDNQLKQLDEYYKLLVEYNKVMNLTGITEEKEVYLKHYYDSLTINKIIDLNNINNMCDIGTGAGFPGLVIAILYPNVKVTLIDSLNKRINFLNIVIEKLGLKNVCALHKRIEEYSKDNVEIFDLVVSRAVAKTNILLEISISMIKINGYFIALKSNIEEEINNSVNAIKTLKCKIEDMIQFKLPIENSNRTIIKIKKERNTPTKYPRKYDKIKKNPL